MAKRNPYRKAHQSVNRQGKQLERVREVSYKHLDSAIGQLYRNLQTTQRGYRGALTKGNERNLALVLDRTARVRQANRRTTHATTKAVDRYGDSGGMLAEELNNLAATNLRTERMATKSAEGDTKLLKGMSKTGKDVMGILQASAREQHANADTIAAEALSRRTTEDQTLIASQHHDIAMAKLQAQLEMKQLKQQQQFAEKALGSETYASMRPQVEAASDMVPIILNNKDKTPEEIKQLLVEAGLIDAADAQTQAITALIYNLTHNTIKDAPDDVAAEVLDAFNDMPQWQAMSKKQRERMRSLIAKQFTTARLKEILDAADPATKPEAGSSPENDAAMQAAYEMVNGITAP
jgi:hypothetical protein